MPRRPGRNDTASAQFDYQRFRIAELRGFLIARIGEVTEGCKTKHAIINKLRQEDEDYQFRFLHLPAEIRNQIYGYLLHLPQYPRARKCWPSIILTSKEVRDEAEDVLYRENDCQVMFFESQDPRPVHTNPAMVLNHNCRFSMHVESTGYGSQHAYALSTLESKFPALLLKAQRLSIWVTPKKQDANAASPLGWVDLQRTNSYLYDLCSHLIQNKQLKKVSVKVQAEDCPGFSDIEKKVLWPLAKLPCPDHTTITGVSTTTAEHLFTEMRRINTGHHVREAINLLHRAQKAYSISKLVIENTKSKSVVRETTLSTRTAVVQQRGLERLRSFVVALRADLDIRPYVDEAADAKLAGFVQKHEAELGRLSELVKKAVERKMEECQSLLNALDGHETGPADDSGRRPRRITAAVSSGDSSEWSDDSDS